MSLDLLVLCLAAVALVAAATSILVGLALPGLDRLAARVPPRHRAWLWLGAAALPAAVGLLAVVVALLPALGLGHDHCLAHGPHHPHLCPHHAGAGPGLALVVVAGLLAARAVFVSARLLRDLRAGRAAASALLEAADDRAGLLVFPAEHPQAFVLGALRPRVHVSRGLLELGAELSEAVLAHERVHARRRDPLWRAIYPAIAVGHVPRLAAALGARFAAAQESAADAEAAASLPGGTVRVAEALVALARLGPRPTPGISIMHGDLRGRVHALLEGRPARAAWPARAAAAAALGLGLASVLAHDHVHHCLETVLGALS